jgi:hypothetical protein
MSGTTIRETVRVYRPCQRANEVARNILEGRIHDELHQPDQNDQAEIGQQDSKVEHTARMNKHDL